jgi:small multidrug resistance pump
MNSNLISYAFLGIAIVAEVLGTTFLQKSEQFTKLTPSIFTAVFYMLTFYFLSQALKTIPLGIAYGIWGSLGIVLTSIVGYFLFKQKLDLPAMIGIAMMCGGVLVVQVFSKTTTH